MSIEEPGSRNSVELMTNWNRRPHVKAKPIALQKNSTEKELIFFKFTKVPYLQNIKTVYASPAGSYAVLRSDKVRIEFSKSPKPLDFREVMKRIAPHRWPDAMINSSFHHTVDCYLKGAGGKVILPAHSFLLAYRSTALFEKMIGVGKNSSDGISLSSSISNSNRRIFNISFSDLLDDDLRVVLDYIYFGQTDHPQSFSFSHNRDITSSLKKLGITRSSGPASSFSFAPSLENRMLRPFTDSIVRTSDGDLHCCQAILINRCSFFEAMLDDESRWLLQKEDYGDREEVIVIDMKHCAQEVFEVVLRWIYGEVDPQHLFPARIQKENVEAYVSFLVEVLAISNELLLDELKDILSRVLYLAIDARNIGFFLEIADTYEASSLKDCCINFVVDNLETVIETNILESISDEVIADIEVRLKNLQEECSPHTRGENSIFSQVRLIVEEDSKKRKMERKSIYERQLEERASIHQRQVEERASIRELSGEGMGEDIADEADASPEDVFHVEGSVFDLEMEREHRVDLAVPAKQEKRSPKSGRKANRTPTKFERFEEVSPEKQTFEIRRKSSKTWSTTPDSSLPKVSFASIMSEAEAPLSSPNNYRTPPPPSVARSFENDRDYNSPSQSIKSPTMKDFSVSPLALANSPISIPFKISTKLSQKERRKSKGQTSNEQTEVPSVLAEASPVKAWGLPPSNSQSPQTFSGKKSLKELMQEEASGASKTHSSSHDDSKSVSFRDIQEVQLRANRIQIQKLKKPLSQIQTEEKAMKELEEFYRLTSAATEGEWFVMKCVSRPSTK
ncbi:hypothetical protein HDU67_001178 [Dinochytrium kinnereticum]|nr:hypothetical protein HDU67_001178 [Dinochytrium kinnereticum]